MPPKTRPRSWVRFADARHLDLPARRARALELEHGWTMVAGARLAERVRAEGVRSGVLELTAEGKAWRDAVLPALPALAARLASLHPQLGVRRVRLRLEGERELPPAAVVPTASPAAPGEPPPRAPAARPAATIPGEPGVRLAELAERYLRRQRQER